MNLSDLKAVPPLSVNNILRILREIVDAKATPEYAADIRNQCTTVFHHLVAGHFAHFWFEYPYLLRQFDEFLCGLVSHLVEAGLPLALLGRSPIQDLLSKYKSVSPDSVADVLNCIQTTVDQESGPEYAAKIRAMCKTVLRNAGDGDLAAFREHYAILLGEFDTYLYGIAIDCGDQEERIEEDTAKSWDFARAAGYDPEKEKWPAEATDESWYLPALEELEAAAVQARAALAEAKRKETTQAQPRIIERVESATLSRWQRICSRAPEVLVGILGFTFAWLCGGHSLWRTTSCFVVLLIFASAIWLLARRQYSPTSAQLPSKTS